MIKRSLSLLLILASMSRCGSSTVHTANHAADPVTTDTTPVVRSVTPSVNAMMVYVCDSRTGKKYHFSEHCRGLGNCSHRIVKMTIEEAKNTGRTVCGWENK